MVFCVESGLQVGAIVIARSAGSRGMHSFAEQRSISPNRLPWLSHSGERTVWQDGLGRDIVAKDVDCV